MLVSTSVQIEGEETECCGKDMTTFVLDSDTLLCTVYNIPVCDHNTVAVGPCKL
jgi:hypothetical protein